MTIHDAKEQALKEWGYKNMQEAFEHGVLYENVISTAMHIYAKFKWEEACDEMKDRYGDEYRIEMPEFKL